MNVVTSVRCVASVGGVGLRIVTLLLEFSGSVAVSLPPSRKVFVPKIGLDGAHGNEEDHNVLVPFVADSKMLETEGGVGDLWLRSRVLYKTRACGLTKKQSRSMLRFCRTCPHCCCGAEEQWSRADGRSP